MLLRPPIWEPEGTKFRPYNLSTLLSFYLGKWIGRMLKRRR